MRNSVFQRGSLQRGNSDWLLDPSKTLGAQLEHRLVELEMKVSALQGDRSLAQDGDDGSGDVPLIPNIKELGWVDFKPQLATYWPLPDDWPHRKEMDDEPKHVIEILKEQPRQGQFFRVADISFSAVGNSAVVQNISHNTDAYQIRIRSEILIRTLSELTDCKTKLGPYGHRLLLLRPFKLLISFEKDIRNRLEELEKLHVTGNHGDPREEAPSKGSQEPSHAAGPLKETQSVEALKHLRVLCRAINTYLTRPIKLQHSLSHESGPTITFHDLWCLFKPGYEVVGQEMSRMQLRLLTVDRRYRVVNTTGGRDNARDQNIGMALPVMRTPSLLASEKLKKEGYSHGSLVLECFYIHFDGIHFGPANRTFHIRRFDGERPINSLPIVPLKFYKDAQETREKLLHRGREFAKLANPKVRAHRKYKGLTLDKNQEQVESEVIVDFELAFLQKKDSKPHLGLEGLLVSDEHGELHDPMLGSIPCTVPGCCSNDSIFMDYEVDAYERNSFKESKKPLLEMVPAGSRALTNDQLVLLPPQVHGFVLRTRRWATFDIDLLSDPEYVDGWSNLVIDPDIKETVLALVENHHGSQDHQAKSDAGLSSVDLIQGKGTGLIILLHGEPGVGKTSTAECVASHTKRPLFPITCGDIGDKAETVEANLEKNFQLAHKWGCVLLLDEADVFLNARDEDIQRDSIVSGE
ncbi:hypothetical protein NW767_012584 [Fusarium falciforme]|nr:hypothetical protein NW767_012584 [Fusarium falciforme]